MEYYTYILYSSTLDRYYVGYCQNMEARLRSHLSNHKGYSSRAKDWKIVYKAGFATKSDAYSYERKIKKWKSRKMIESLIQGKGD